MNARKALFVALALLMGGCLPVMSLHPLYTDDDVVFEKELLGSWKADPNENGGIWQFARHDDIENVYKLLICDSDNNKGSFEARLVKLGSRFFLDIYPDEFPCNFEDPNQTDWPYNSIFMVPTHTFIKVESIVPQLKIKLTQDEPLQNLLKDNAGAVDYTIIEDRIVLTSNTKQLQQFILKHADDERLFPDEMILYPMKE